MGCYHPFRNTLSIYHNVTLHPVTMATGYVLFTHRCFVYSNGCRKDGLHKCLGFRTYVRTLQMMWPLGAAALHLKDVLQCGFQQRMDQGEVEFPGWQAGDDTCTNQLQHACRLNLAHTKAVVVHRATIMSRCVQSNA